MTKVIYTDGSGTSRGTSAYCIFLVSWSVPNLETYNFRTHKTKNQKKIIKILPREMNVYEIEYFALLEAIKLIPLPMFGNNGSNYLIYMDSQQIVKELNEKVSRYPNHQEMINKVHQLIEARKCKIEIKWIPREKNLAGIYLERRLEKINNYLKQMSRTPRRARYRFR